MLLVAGSVRDIPLMYNNLGRACASEGLGRMPGRRQLWSNIPPLKVKSSIVLFGPLLCRDRTGAMGHQCGLTRAKFWAITRKLTTIVIWAQACRIS